MRYNKFTIKNYRAIKGPLKIDISKHSLFPIIGVNECGKTTILNAILAFDYFNDDENSTIKHLEDIQNLYDYSEKNSCEIVAEIEIDLKDLEDNISEALKELQDEINNSLTSETLKSGLRKSDFFKKSLYTGNLQIVRQISRDAKNYKIISNSFDFSKQKPHIENEVCEKIIGVMPYILYFDDFRESFPEKIEILKKGKSIWVDYIERLFKNTNNTYSIYNLKSMENRERRTVLSDIKKYLNETLTKEWSNFKLDDTDSLKIDIQYEFTADNNSQKEFLKFDIIEIDQNQKEHYFFLKDRSKGFYWFFNFVMKLEFNPKTNGSDDNAIYLLDEPGSYLHPYAQNRLCLKLNEIAKTNKVFYCTHSHHLLNPEIIPLNRINIVSKSQYGEITLANQNILNKRDTSLRTAFQALDDALNLRPLGLDFWDKQMLLVEGIYDYYVFKLFLNADKYSIMPGRNANSLQTLISHMIGFGIKYKVLWDNDSTGKREFDEAIKFFGEEELAGKIYCLPVKFKILQDLFDSNDMIKFKERLELNTNVSFEKTMATLFYSSNKDIIVATTSQKTKDNFLAVKTYLNID